MAERNSEGMRMTKGVDQRRLRIGFILARSFTLTAFALFADTLRLASDIADKSGRVLADWQVLGSTRHLVTSSCGVQVSPTSDFVDPQRFDYIVVVGGLLTVETPIDWETSRYIQKAAEKGVPLIGLCTGSFILASLGLMNAHETCVSWLHYDEFRQRFPDLKVRADRIYNLDGSRGSCAGGSSAADIAATIVRLNISRQAERNALEVLQIERTRPALHNQARKPLGIECDEPRMKSTLMAMERNLEQPIALEKMAGDVGLSRRQLERLFLRHTGSTPAEIYRRMRLERARELLITSKMPLVEIALEVGFEGSSHFCRAFRKVYGKSPNALRKDQSATSRGLETFLSDPKEFL